MSYFLNANLVHKWRRLRASVLPERPTGALDELNVAQVDRCRRRPCPNMATAVRA